MSPKHTPEHWREAARKISDHAAYRQRIHISDVGEALEISGRQSIMNAIEKMVELNVMYFEIVKQRKEYFLT